MLFFAVIGVIATIGYVYSDTLIEQLKDYSKESDPVAPKRYVLDKENHVWLATVDQPATVSLNNDN